MKRRNAFFVAFVAIHLMLLGFCARLFAEAWNPPNDPPTAVAVAVAADAGVATIDAGPSAPNPDGDPIGFFVELFQGVKSGKWLAVGALLLTAVTFALRKVLGPSVPFFKTDEGGVILVFGTSLLGALANALWVGSKVDGAMVWAAVVTAATAAGGYSAVKRLGSKALVWVIAKFKKGA